MRNLEWTENLLNSVNKGTTVVILYVNTVFRQAIFHIRCKRKLLHYCLDQSLSGEWLPQWRLNNHASEQVSWDLLSDVGLLKAHSECLLIVESAVAIEASEEVSLKLSLIYRYQMVFF